MFDRIVLFTTLGHVWSIPLTARIFVLFCPASMQRPVHTQTSTFDSEPMISLRPTHICIPESCDCANLQFESHPDALHSAVRDRPGAVVGCSTLGRRDSAPRQQNKANIRSEMKTAESVILQLRFFLRCHRRSLASKGAVHSGGSWGVWLLCNHSGVKRNVQIEPIGPFPARKSAPKQTPALESG